MTAAIRYVVMDVQKHEGSTPGTVGFLLLKIHFLKS